MRATPSTARLLIVMGALGMFSVSALGCSTTQSSSSPPGSSGTTVASPDCASRRPAGMATPRLDQMSDGPYHHSVWVGQVSKDGLTATGSRQVRQHASVPDAVRLRDGSVAIYYVNGTSGAIERARWDGSVLSPGEEISIDGADGATAVDPDVSLTDDGRVRLAFFAGFGAPTPGKAHVMCVAESADGKSFSGARPIYRGQNLTDPSLIVDGDRWTLAVSQGQRSLVAVSTDNGATFRDVASVAGGVPEIAKEPGGTGLELFTCNKGISVSTSSDGGSTWTTSGQMGGLPRGGNCDPSLVANTADNSGRTTFVFKTIDGMR